LGVPHAFVLTKAWGGSPFGLGL